MHAPACADPEEAGPRSQWLTAPTTLEPRHPPSPTRPPIPWQPDSRNKTVHLAKWPLSKMSDEHLAAAAAAAAAASSAI